MGNSEQDEDHGLKGANTTTELCPPNPKELEIAANKGGKIKRRFRSFTIYLKGKKKE